MIAAQGLMRWRLAVLRAVMLVGLVLCSTGSVQAQGAADVALGTAEVGSEVDRPIQLSPTMTLSPAAAAVPTAQSPQATASSSQPATASAGRPRETRADASANSQGIRVDLRLPQSNGKGSDTSLAVRIVLGLTLLAVLPALVVCVTAFLRIIIVMSMLRHAIGMPETPPNTVLIGLALFMTLFTMSPVLQSVNDNALQPFMQGTLTTEDAFAKGSQPLREFMVKQTREQDLALMVELSKAKQPQSMDDISNIQLVPAFMLSELRAAFQIGFVIFLPFLLIDLIVSSILMALGMMMMPPVTIALPLKVLMFILVDGWSLILKALVGSFH